MRWPQFLEPLLDGADKTARLRATERAEVIASTIEWAADSRERNRGLLGRDEFPDGRAMIIAPTNAVHTWFMRFPIDLVFAAGDGRVVKIARAVKPWRMAAAWRAAAVIELPAGTAARCGIAPGDHLFIEIATDPSASTSR